MKELVTFLAAALVDDREAVRVNEVERDDATVFELRVAKEDLGKVIGKQGRTARAIRSLLSASAARENRKARLEILD
ncbi:MAG: KH domain-containing protein [Desulfurivibrionaceae bacterium]|nr:KH domain-containing protein [Desulfobulbales bacterium]MDT8335984.1 KH domain-containing protein [Desulfurivibrionaceae bacterium]